MNREYKFRAWRESQKQMLHNVGFHPHLAMDLAGDDDHYKTHREGRWLCCPAMRLDIVMQFIGIKDMANEELYEDDVVEFDDVNEIAEYTARGVIKFNHQQCGYWIEFKRNGKNHYRLINVSFGDGETYRDDSIKKVGDIYSNPELLK